MNITDKYITQTEANKLEKPDPERITLSDDAFAICEFIDNLIKKAEHLRISMMR